MKKDTPPTRVYQIIDWEKHYENAKSINVDHKTFSCTPNKQDGLGYQLLLKENNGIALYGVFVAITLVASKFHKTRKGWLTVDGKPGSRPLTAHDLFIKTHMPTKLIQRMLDTCCDLRIGWIRVYDVEYNCGKWIQKDTSGDSEGYQVYSESPLEGIEGIEGGRDQTPLPPAESPSALSPGKNRLPTAEEFTAMCDDEQGVWVKAGHGEAILGGGV